jgi:hypothetical protein
VVADEALMASLSKELSLPDRYLAFLKVADPVDVETATPSERIRLIPAADLLAE